MTRKEKNKLLRFIKEKMAFFQFGTIRNKENWRVELIANIQDKELIEIIIKYLNED